MSVDTRTRPINCAGPEDPASFFEGAWRDAAARHGRRAAEDAARLGLPPITIQVDEAAWTLQPAAEGIDVVPGPAGAGPTVSLDGAAFADLFCERRTAHGSGHRRAGRGRAGLQRRLLRLGPCPALPPRRPTGLRGRGRLAPGPGRIAARPRPAVPPRRDHGRGRPFPRRKPASSCCRTCSPRRRWMRSTPTCASRSRRPGPTTARRGGRPPAAARPTPAASSTSHSSRRRCEPSLPASATSPSVELLGDGHRPGDPFGEHFADVTAEGLLKRVDSVDGLVCLPWHKDCDRGGHSMFC